MSGRPGLDGARPGARVTIAAALALSACTSSSPSPAPTTRVTTIVSTVTTSRTPSAPPSVAPFTPAPTVRPLPPGDDPAAGEVERTCPYIKAGVTAEPTDDPNVADIEGDHVARVTVLTRLTPVGCRFYFYAPPYGPVADIVPRTYATAAEATAALRSIVRYGTRAEERPGFAAGLDGVRFRSPFFGPDGGQDGSFAFAKGRVLVIVHTRQTNQTLSAELLAKAVVGRF